MYAAHIDERGSFQELIKLNNMFVKQISYCIANPNVTRGGHFHKELSEVFIVIKGCMTLTLETESGVKLKKVLKNEEGYEQQYFILPYVKHTVEASDEGCEFIILANRQFDEKNPDTYREWQ